jgi:REP element-mobilizing transposase RayT
MSDRGFQIKDQYAVHFLTFTVVEWVDVFTRNTYSDILIDSLKFCQEKKGLKIHAWCIMSNHIHLILSTDGVKKLSDVIRDFKKFSSYAIINAIQNNPKESRKKWMLWIFGKAGKFNSRNENFQFWQQTNHPVECSTEDILMSRMQYLHENPIRAGIVNFEQDYLYSSGIDYYGNGQGLIKIDFV